MTFQFKPINKRAAADIENKVIILLKKPVDIVWNCYHRSLANQTLRAYSIFIMSKMLEKRAEDRLVAHAADLDVTRAEAALQRALRRLDVAEKYGKQW